MTSNSEKGNDPVIERFMLRFESEIMERIHAGMASGDLKERGQVRIALRITNNGMIKDINAQIDEPMEQFRLCKVWADRFLDYTEVQLARETMTAGLEFAANMSGTPGVLARVDGELFLAECDRKDILAESTYHTSPVSVSRLLMSLRRIRDALQGMFTDLSTSEQETSAWQILNCVKAIVDTAQPLVWVSCGKYVTETLLFAGMCMDTVINLCTVRHMQLRMKVYISSFFSAAVHNNTDQAGAILSALQTQLGELIEREEIDEDVPVPAVTVDALSEFETDMAVMRCVSNFMKNPDGLEDFLAFDGNPKYFADGDAGISYTERCLLECARLQDLTSSNMNESWQRKSAAIIKAFKSKLADEEANITWTHDGLTDLSSLVLFSRDEDGDAAPLLASIREVASKQSEGGDNDPATSYTSTEFTILHTMSRILFPPVPAAATEVEPEEGEGEGVQPKEQEDPEEARFTALQQLVLHIEDVLHGDEYPNRSSFLRRIVGTLWSKYMYGQVQEALTRCSYASESAMKLLSGILPAMTMAVRVLNDVSQQDPLLTGSVALLTGLVLRELNDRRNAISLILQSLDFIDDARAQRVDLVMNASEDLRDLKALQKVSFTTTATADDWFHSEKRLGAHAFAGHGIFGAASQTDRIDQALAEVHVDLLALYFRLEIEYAIEQRSFKTNARKKGHLSATVTMGEAGGGTFITLRDSLIGLGASEHTLMNVEESLSCIASLKRYCGKNEYSTCVLLMEIARVEADVQRRLALLDQTKDCIERADKQEKALLEANSNFTVLTDRKRTKPLVLARSHKFIYVAPVACRRDVDATSYRVLARDEGSGGAVTLNNDNISGCEVLVPLKEFSHPSRCPVRLQFLQSGERYVFGSTGVTADGEPTGSVSPTTAPCAAVNPLPKLMLWSYLCQLAADVGGDAVCHLAASRVCTSFFITLPEEQVQPRARGYNLFLVREPILYMVKVHQSSPVLLKGFINSFLNMQLVTHAGDSGRGKSGLHWDVKTSNQMATVGVLRETALVATVAASIGSHSAVLRSADLAYKLAAELLEYDIVATADYIQHALLMVTTCFTVIPKSSWHDFEHTLYALLSHCVARCSLHCRNTQPVAVFLGQTTDYLLENTDSERAKAFMAQVRPDYAALMAACRLERGMILTDEWKDKMVSLLRGTDTAVSAENFWDVAAVARALELEEAATTLASEGAPGHPLYAALTGIPGRASDLITSLVVCAQRVSTSDTEGASVSTLLTNVPIYEEMLSEEARNIAREWKLPFITAVNADEEDAPTGPFERDDEGVLVIPEVFSEATPEETSEQLHGLGQLMVLLAEGSYTLRKKIDYPTSGEGLLADIDPEKEEDFQDTDGKNIVQKDGAPDSARGDAEVEGEKSFSELDYIKSMCASVALSCLAKSSATAVDTAAVLTNYLIDQWKHPSHFTNAQAESIAPVLAMCKSVVMRLENISGVDTLHEAPDMGEELAASTTLVATDTEVGTLGIAVHELVPHRDLQEYLYLVQTLLVYAVKMLWTHQSFKDVVDLGVDVLNLYVEKAPEFCKGLGFECSRLVVHAQNKIVSTAQHVHETKIAEKAAFIRNYEEEQAKKRKKRLRIARLEKSDEEIKFEEDCAALQAQVNEAHRLLRRTEARQEVVLMLSKRVDTLSSTGVQLLDKVKKSATEFVEDCSRNHGADNVVAALATRDGIDTLDALLFRFDQVVSILRDKKERLSVLEALHFQGDLLLRFGKVVEAKKVWLDSVDGVFNAMDTCSNYAEVLAGVPSGDRTILLGSVPAVVVLGKLAKYCSLDCLDDKLRYSRFAAELMKWPFSESIAHPTTLPGFAAYACKSLGGIAPLAANTDLLSAAGLESSLREVIAILQHEDMCLEALPAVVLLEHFHACYTCDANLWLQVRVSRLRLLTSLRMFAEAFSMASDILPALRAIRARTYDRPLVYVSAGDDAVLSREEFDISKNGLLFNKRAPFFANEPPHSEANIQAITWIQSLSDEIETYAQGERMDLTPDEVQRMKDKADAAAAAAAEAAAADPKAKKGKGAPEEPATPDTTTSIFSTFTLLSLRAACAQAVMQLSMLESRSIVEHAPTLHGFLDGAKTLYVAIAGRVATSDSLPLDPGILALYGESQMAISNILVHRNELRAARMPVSRLAERLAVGPPSGESFPASVKYELTKLWLHLRLWQARLALRQARFTQAIAVSSDAIVAATAVSSNHTVRDLLEIRASAMYKSGNFDGAERDYSMCIEHYRRANICNSNSIKCTIAYITVLRERSSSIHARAEAVPVMEKCLELARECSTSADHLARQHGFVGVNANAIFETSASVVSDFALRAPFMHNLTTVFGNEPPLFTEETVSFDVQAAQLRSKWRAPKDVALVYPENPFVGIYTEQVQTLVAAHACLCIVLDEVRSTGLFDGETLVREEFVYAEAGLKAARCCVYISPAVRVTLLLLLGRSMLEIARLEPGSFTGEDVVAPLKAGLEICTDELHPWESMSKLLLELVECYNDKQIWQASGALSEDNMQIAVRYLDAAVKVASQRDALRTQFMTDNSFDKPVPENLSKLLKSHGFSSAVAPAVVGTDAPPEDTGKGGKGGKGAAPAAAGPSDMSGRDAVTLMASLMREGNPLLLTDQQFSLRADIHAALKEGFPKYSSDLTLDKEALSTETPVVVASCSSSMLWVPAKMPDFDPEVPETDHEGVFLGFDGYMILGGVDPEATDVSSAALTKVRMSLREAVAIERKLKELVWILKIATDKKAKAENRVVAAGFKSVLNDIAAGMSPTLKGEMTSDVSIDDETQDIRAELTLNGTTVALSGDMETLVALASVFSQESSVHQLVHAGVCKFFRATLGFPTE